MVSRSTTQTNASRVGEDVSALPVFVARHARDHDLALVANNRAQRRQRTLLAHHATLGRTVAAATFESHAGLGPFIPGDAALRRLHRRAAVARAALLGLWLSAQRISALGVARRWSDSRRDLVGGLRHELHANKRSLLHDRHRARAR